MNSASVAAPSASESASTPLARAWKSWRSRDFGAGRSKNGLAMNSATSFAIGRAGGGELPVLVEAQAAAAQHEIVEQRARRAGVEGDHRVAVDIGDVADAAEIEDHHGLGERRSPARGDRAARTARLRRRRPRPRGGSGRPCRCRAPAATRCAEAELAREAHLRPVIDRLAVQADEARRPRPRSRLPS